MADNPPIQRRLAAIPAADVAGYSRLMGAGEEGTLRRLKALRTEPGGVCISHMVQMLDEARAIVAKLRAITSLVMPSDLPNRNPAVRELLLSGLRLAMGETA